jgi:TusA-related sulfurtransferase
MAAVTQKLVAGSEQIADLPATKRIDTRGLVCPFPAFEAGKLAQTAGPDDVLEIVTNDEYTATASIPSVLKIRRLEYSVVKNEDGTFLIKARSQAPKTR